MTRRSSSAVKMLTTVRSRNGKFSLIHKMTIMADAADEVPQTQCPKCGAWVDDYDGFGVLAHSECGYCCHPSASGSPLTCGICGAVIDTEGKQT